MSLCTLPEPGTSIARIWGRVYEWLRLANAITISVDVRKGQSVTLPIRLRNLDGFPRGEHLSART